MRCFPQQISPFLSVDTSQGVMATLAGPERFRGVDVEILKKIAEHLGVELRFHPGSEPGILPLFDAIDQGYGDLMVGGLTITENRSRRFSMSAPYFRFDDLLIGPKSAEGSVPLTTGHFAVLPGTSHDEKARAHGLTPRLTYFEFVGEAYEAVAEGKVELSFADSTMLDYDQLFGVQVLYRLGEPRGYGYAMAKDSDLQPVVDEVLAELQRTGELDKILDRFNAHGSHDLSSMPRISWNDLSVEAP